MVGLLAAKEAHVSTWTRLRGFMVDYADAAYGSIKEAADRWTRAMRGRDRAYGIEDFLVMTPQRDPFYAGTPGDVAAAEWFMAVWNQQGMDARAAEGRTVYVRTMHYTATAPDPLERITPPPPPWGRGRAYENITSDYDQMVFASVIARYLGYLPFDAIVDNRNKSSIYNADDEPFEPEKRPEVQITTYYGKYDEITLPDPNDVTATNRLITRTYGPGQRYLLAVIAEKDKVRDLILPTLEEMEADFILASGETSLTQTWDFCRKCLEMNRSGRVLYLSDYDPAGNDMPMVVARRIEWFVHSPRSRLYEEFQQYLDAGNDITLRVLAITKEQKEDYSLPPTMLKASVKDRRTHWQAKHGEEGVELDVFDRERLNGVLDGVVRDALAPFYDAGLASRAQDAEYAADRYLKGVTDDVVASHLGRLNALRNEYEAIYYDVMPQLDDIREQIEAEITQIEAELEVARADAENKIAEQYPLPVAEISDVDGSEALLWTERDYYDQLMKYKEHLGRVEPGKPSRVA